MGDWQSAIDVENESHEQEIDPQLSAQIIKMTNEKAEIDHARSHLVNGFHSSKTSNRIQMKTVPS